MRPAGTLRSLYPITFPHLEAQMGRTWVQPRGTQVMTATPTGVAINLNGVPKIVTAQVTGAAAGTWTVTITAAEAAGLGNDFDPAGALDRFPSAGYTASFVADGGDDASAIAAGLEAALDIALADEPFTASVLTDTVTITEASQTRGARTVYKGIDFLVTVTPPGVGTATVACTQHPCGYVRGATYTVRELVESSGQEVRRHRPGAKHLNATKTAARIPTNGVMQAETPPLRTADGAWIYSVAATTQAIYVDVLDWMSEG